MNPLLNFVPLPQLSADWAALAVDLTVKGSLLLALLGLAAAIMRQTSASARHLVWTLGIAGLIVLPLLTVALPTWTVESLPRYLPAFAATPTARPLAGGVVRTDAGPRSADDATASGPAGAMRPIPPDESIRPAERATTPPSAPPGRPIEPTGAQHSPPAGVSLATALFFVYIAGFLLVLGVFITGYAMLWQLVRRSEPLTDRAWTQLADRLAVEVDLPSGSFRIMRSDRALSPMTWGWRQSAVLLPNSCDSWTEHQRQEVLVHELSHVKRRDCLTQLIANTACVLYWFNPLVWYAARQMITERERACDDQVLLKGAKASDYAQNLLDIARSLGASMSTAQVSAAMARRSQISGRLLAVLDPHLKRQALQRRSIVTTSVILAALLIPLAALSPGAGRLDAAPGHLYETTDDILAGDLEARGGRDGRQTDRPDVRKMRMEQIREQIEEVNRKFEEAVRERDAAAIADLYTPDAQLMPIGVPACEGRWAIEDFWIQLLKGQCRDIDLQTDELFRMGELVCEIGRFKLLNCPEAKFRGGRYMCIWKHMNGRWYIHRDMSTF